MRDPDRDGERQREHVVGVRGDGAGALDAVDTPTLALGLSTDASPQALLAKIDQIGRLLESRTAALVPPGPAPERGQPTLVAIGASAGGRPR